MVIACHVQINVKDLSAGERINLGGVLLQAWTVFQQQSHHQQSSQYALSILYPQALTLSCHLA